MPRSSTRKGEVGKTIHFHICFTSKNIGSPLNIFKIAIRKKFTSQKNDCFQVSEGPSPYSAANGPPSASPKDPRKDKKIVAATPAETAAPIKPMIRRKPGPLGRHALKTWR